MNGRKRLWILLALFLALVPLGLLSDAPAWGEWGHHYYQKLLGYIPAGIARAEGIDAPLADYSVPHLGGVLGYYLSALIGASVLYLLFVLMLKVQKR